MTSTRKCIVGDSHGPRTDIAARGHRNRYRTFCEQNRPPIVQISKGCRNVTFVANDVGVAAAMTADGGNAHEEEEKRVNATKYRPSRTFYVATFIFKPRNDFFSSIFQNRTTETSLRFCQINLQMSFSRAKTRAPT
jgi:hypothetical protein